MSKPSLPAEDVWQSRPTRPSALAYSGGVALLPFLAYLRAVLHRYGFRDDFPILREARNEPGKISRVIGSQGRLIYGWLLERTAFFATGIDGLRWFRVGTVVGLAIFAVVLFWVLVRMGWSMPWAAFLSGWLVLLPSAQVLVSWSICGPQVTAVILSVLAFASAEEAFRDNASRRARWLGWPLAIVGLAAAASTYQSHSLLYLVPLTAGWLLPSAHERKPSWGAKHLLVLGAGLVAAFLAMEVSFATGWVPHSARIRFEPNLLIKLRWFIAEVVPDAMAQLALDRFPQSPGAGYWVAALSVGALVVLGGMVEGHLSGSRRALRWAVGGVLLSAAAYSISYIASETAPTYRALYALAGVWSVYLVASLDRLSRVTGSLGRWLLPAEGLGVLRVILMLGAILLAARHTWELFAVPQGRELHLLEAGVHEAAAMPVGTRVFVVAATQGDSSAPHRYRDEFGSVSLDAAWIIKDAFLLLMKEELPRGDEAMTHCQFAAGPTLPPPGSYDLLIDLRQMRQVRP